MMKPDVMSRIQSVLDCDIRPRVQAHGGDVTIAACHDGLVEVEFRAACTACELRPVTFAATVRRALLQIEGVTEVRCQSVPFRAAKLDAIASFFA